jgi:hypothetical protein
MKKILIIGDSSIPPRAETSYRSTYTTLLKNIHINDSIEVSSKTGISSRSIYIDLEPLTLYGYNPNIVILNYGIVDVFPRPYPHKVYRLLSCSGLLPYVDRFLKKSGLYYKIGDLFDFKEVSLKKFHYYTEHTIKKLLDNNVEKIIIIGIIKPYKVLLKSKKVDREVKDYNNVFKEIALKYNKVSYIDIYHDSNEDFTIWDGYHYSDKASFYLAQEIEQIILDD